MFAANRRQRWVVRKASTTAGLLFVAGLLLVGFGALTVPLLFGEHSAQDDHLVQDLQGTTLVELKPLPGWPQWRGPRRDGVTDSPGLLTAWPEEGPRVLWRAAVGAGYSSVSVANGLACTLGRGDNNEEVVLCWDAATGKEKWHFAYQGAFKANDYKGTRSSPIFDGDRVYTLGGAGLLYCLEAATGKEVWHLDLLQEFSAPNLQWGMAQSPLIEGDRLFVNPGGANDNSLAALDKNNGKILWRKHAYPAAYSSPIAIGPPDRRQIIFFTGNSVVSVAPNDGRLYWEYPWITDYGVNAATPLCFQTQGAGQTHDYLFVSSGYKKGCAVLEVFGMKTGELSVKRVYENDRLCCKFSSPVRFKDTVYGFDDTRGLTCLDLMTGALRWQESRTYSKMGTLLLAEGYLIVLGENGRLGLVVPSPEGPYQNHEKALVHLLNGGGQNWAMPALAEGRLYVRSPDEVLCLDLHQ